MMLKMMLFRMKKKKKKKKKKKQRERDLASVGASIADTFFEALTMSLPFVAWECPEGGRVQPCT